MKNPSVKKSASRSALCAFLLLPLGSAVADGLQTSVIQVVGTAPLPGVERTIEQVPANIRYFGRSALDDAAQTTLPDALAVRLPGVNLNETQGNPLQPDFNYLQADYRLDPAWILFARLNNALDRRYASGGALAENPFDRQGAFIADTDGWRREAFLAPGAPRSFWVGVRYRLAEK